MYLPPTAAGTSRPTPCMHTLKPEPHLYLRPAASPPRPPAPPTATRHKEASGRAEVDSSQAKPKPDKQWPGINFPSSPESPLLPRSFRLRNIYSVVPLPPLRALPCPSVPFRASLHAAPPFFGFRGKTNTPDLPRPTFSMLRAQLIYSCCPTSVFTMRATLRRPHTVHHTVPPVRWHLRVRPSFFP